MLANLLQIALEKNDYKIAPHTQEQFIAYLELLIKWNKAFNLTRICEPEAMVFGHILDSLSIGSYLQGENVIDIGTGAGLPGIPLALQYPEKKFFLLDSNQKKTRFLTQVKFTLKIPNIEIISARCEKFSSNILFDSIISRAFASLSDMLEGTCHLLAKNGQFLAMKGVYPTDEIAAIQPPFRLLAVHPLIIHGLNAQRHLICLGQEG